MTPRIISSLYLLFFFAPNTVIRHVTQCSFQHSSHACPSDSSWDRNACFHFFLGKLLYIPRKLAQIRKKKNDVTYVNKLKRVRYYCYQIVTWGKCQSVSNLPSHILSYLPSSCQKFRRVVVKSRRVCAFSFLFSFNF